jgi:hypothetical protein
LPVPLFSAPSLPVSSFQRVQDVGVQTAPLFLIRDIGLDDFNTDGKKNGTKTRQTLQRESR